MSNENIDKNLYSNVLYLDPINECIQSTFVFWNNLFNSEFKVIINNHNPIFTLYDDKFNKVDMIYIRITENKFSCKILKPKQGKYCLKISSEKRYYEIDFEIKRYYEKEVEEF